VLMKQLMVLDAARLRSALVGIFEGRRQQVLPDSLPPPPTDCAVPYRKLAKEVGVHPDLRAGYAEAAALLDPALADRATGRWNPKKGFMGVTHSSKLSATFRSAAAPKPSPCNQLLPNDGKSFRFVATQQSQITVPNFVPFVPEIVPDPDVSLFSSIMLSRIASCDRETPSTPWGLLLSTVTK
jgi:hypothetical protein